MKTNTKKPKRTFKQRVDAEFKTLRKRIERLEERALTNVVDNGLVSEPVKKNEKKG